MFASSYTLITNIEWFILLRSHQQRVGIFVSDAKYSMMKYKGVSAELTAHDK